MLPGAAARQLTENSPPIPPFAVWPVGGVLRTWLREKGILVLEPNGPVDLLQKKRKGMGWQGFSVQNYLPTLAGYLRAVEAAVRLRVWGILRRNRAFLVCRLRGGRTACLRPTGGGR